MFEKLHPLAERAIGRVVDFSQRRAWLVIAMAFVLAGTGIKIVIDRIAINTDTEQMLSASLPWRVAYSNYKKAFPYFSDNIVVMVNAPTPDLAHDIAIRLRDRFLAAEKLIDDVFYPRGDAFVMENQLMFLDLEALESLTDELSAAQPFLSQLNRSKSSATLLQLIDRGIQDDAGAGDASSLLTRPVNAIALAIDEVLSGDHVPMSWQQLITGASAERGTYREFVVLRPALDYSELLPAAAPMTFINSVIDEIQQDVAVPIEIRLTGDAALSYDELHSVIHGSQQAGILALVMVLICLTVGLRSIALVIATLVTLLVGLIFTATFAVLFVGTLNMISIAFAVLYVGLGVDFAIHICLRYRELLQSYEPDFAVNQASRHVGVSLILCAFTSAIGFLRLSRQPTAASPS